jgi:Putative auto-transporter adhesin, head GIN domain
LIFAGLGLIFRRSLPWVWDVIALLVVVALFLAVVFAPRIGLPTSPVFGASPFMFFGPVASGDVIRQERPVSGFDAIAISYPSDVTITQGTTEGLVIEAPSDILPDIDTQVRGGVLHIDARPGLGLLARSQSGLVKIAITVKDISAIDFSGAGRVRAVDLQTDALRTTVSGAGEFDLVNLTARDVSVVLSGAGGMSASGRSATTSLRVNLSGVGSYNGGELQSRTAEVQISGAGSATVWVTGELTARISGLGSIRYYGSPNVNKQVSGLGNVTSLGGK